jgi:hypothetical protein
VIDRSAVWAYRVVAAAVALACLAPAAQAVTLEHISQGEGSAGNASLPTSFEGASRDGTRVFLTSYEGLTPEDTDGSIDVFERANGVTTRISFGSIGGNILSDANFLAASDDGSHVFFRTGEALVPEDTRGKCYVEAEGYRGCTDIYERSGGTTTLVTPPVSPGSSYSARFGGISKDGLHVFFMTAEPMVAADTDGAIDVYERYSGVIRLVSTGPTDANTDDDAIFKGSSEDGGRAFFETSARLASADSDSQADVYERSGGATTLVSTGSSGGNGAADAAFKGASADGSRVFIETTEPLTSGDTDSSGDVYQRSGGSTTLVSTGPAGGNGAADAHFEDTSDAGTKVWFETSESLVAGDTDGRKDVYERSGSTTALVSTGPTGGSGAFDATFQGASQDGTRIWFGTFEQLAPTDLDSVFDVYERSGGTTAQVSLGPAGGNGSFDAFFDAASTDAARVFFETQESLTSEDTDAYVDVYQRAGGATTLVSSPPSGSAASWDSLVGASDDGKRVFFVTGDKLASSDTDTQSDIYASVDIPGFPRPRGATPFSMPLVIAYRDCTSANTVHGAPLSSPSCKPPVPASDWLTVGTPDANGQGARSVGNLYVKAGSGDVALGLSITDVRNKSGLTDYAGELGVRLDLRLTDKLNGAAPVDPATVSDFPFEFKGTCSPTSDTTVGSTCSVGTTANAVLPGAVSAGNRAIWEIRPVQVFDGGSDGNFDTAPNTLFERQGVFVP